MSEPPKKKLRQCSLQESFKKAPSFEERKTRSKTRATENNSADIICVESGDQENMDHVSKEKVLQAAEARRELDLKLQLERKHQSPDVTPNHETEYPDAGPSNTAAKHKEGAVSSPGPQSSTSRSSRGTGADFAAAAAEEDLMTGDSQGSALSATEEEKQGYYDEESMEVLLEEELKSHSHVQKKDKTPFKGTPKEELNRMPSCAGNLNKLYSHERQTVLFKTDTLALGSHPPSPWPREYVDKWDADHVKLPCSRENMYPVEGKDGHKEIKSRWEVIQEALLNDILTVQDLEDAIKSYNTRYANKWNFRGLHAFFTEELDKNETEEFFDKLLPAMKSLALRMPELCTHGIPLLKKQKQQTVLLSQEQIACLLANAFFCTFPRRNAHGKNSEYSTYPDINFNQLFVGSKHGIHEIKAEKLKCILHYFKRITQSMPTGTVSFRRQVINKCPQWDSCSDQMTRLHVTSKGTIEDDGKGMIQVDFANKFLGGGVLGYGCVQEEIRFLLCPEMIISRLITEVLEKNESLIMTGCERFSNYSGYANTFRWTGDHKDLTLRDDWGRLFTEVVAIDALVFRSYSDQFHSHCITRELNKAYSGFVSPGTEVHHLSALATGNWGCGAFGGDLRLKSLLQLMAASAAKRDVCYFTFHDCDLRNDLYDIHTFITKKNLAISDLMAIIQMYERYLERHRRSDMTLFDFIYKTYTDSDADGTDTTDDIQSGAGSPELQYWNRNQPSPDYSAATP